MEISTILKFIKSFWREIAIATLFVAVFILNLQKEALSVTVSLKEQEIVNIEERLRTSNASISQLQGEIDNQNWKLEEVSKIEQEQLQKSKIEIEKAKMTNEQLQKEIDNLNDIQESGDVCKDVIRLLDNVGE